ncbi:hypothetical protein CFR78_03480 [Komagataeibacter rhaeticus]|uniref:hypothetical protein n=1 Tax=Komagataeibacter rhaeticus TaxID=215221 RepID=UPI0004DB02ED|nr:hypothetical protein [Komagataeibacter rhaeticus]KDU95824.1 hypothetical protein GLUCORHAEAF1_06915 [Komagataeibacter rhaeticus AF1]MBL7240162.1 hypothetical protein [Komagataeibacter rhaeticus]PYD54690.1 hypothetical protein CFR78_03480 [Komagataeibacter rhaeticus]
MTRLAHGLRRTVMMGALLLAGPGYAHAADGAPPDTQTPYVTPQNDVDVSYAIYPPHDTSAVMTQRMRWSAGTMMQRVDPGNAATYMITDYHAGTLTVVNADQKVKTVIPAPGAANVAMGQRAQGNWLRTGVSNVVGTPCTLWQTQDTDQRPSEICYTDDGVMMEVRRDGKVMVEATSITRDPQPASVFAVPAGLKELHAAHP